MAGSVPSRRLASIVVGVIALLAPVAAAAQTPSGSTLAPDFQSYMINKDLGSERWTINLNLFTTDPADIVSVTGNIFRSDGGPASFVTCLVRDDSTGSLSNPGSTFRLSCSGASACQTTAERCAREDWTLIDDDVRVPASFFLPPGGNGAASVSAAGAAWFADALIARLAAALERLRGSAMARGGLALALPRSAFAQSSGGRGATLTLDLLNHLVTKDVGGERWSISYGLVPFVTDEQGVATRFLSVTGNVFQPDGTPPSFVYCTQRADSTGTLSDPNSEFRFACQGADACTTTATACAASGWRTISDDVRLSASFFLPPGGLPASPQSDPDIVVIGRTSDPPSLSAPGSEGAASGALDRPAGSCPVGAECIVPRIGSCQSVPGEVVDDPQVGCRCFLAQVPPSCIACDGGASGQCGGSCEYAVGDATARGTCLPFDSSTEDCVCYAIGAGQELTTQGCGGALEQQCPGDRCCTDDPRGSCDPLGESVSCPGVCVDADGCDPTAEQCGTCFAPRDLPTPTPDATPTPEPTGAPSATPEPTPTPSPTPIATPSPSPTPCRGQGQSCLGEPAPCCDGLVCDFLPSSERYACVPIIP